MRNQLRWTTTILWALALPGIAQAHCTGDCSDDGTVAINEVISCVNIGLGLQQLSQCDVCDTNEDGSVTINEIITSVNIGLGLLPCEVDEATPTAAPTRTPTPGQPSGDSASVEKFITGFIGSFSDLTDVASPQGQGGGSGFNPFPITSPCQIDGTQTFNCVAAAGGNEIEIQFDECLSRSGNLSTELEAIIVLNTAGNCLTNLFPPNSTYNMSFDGRVTETNLSTGAIFTADNDVIITFSVQSNGTVRMSLMGAGTASCIPGTSTFSTTEELVIPMNSDCPTSGRLRVEIAGEGAHEVIYSNSGVQIDLGADGSIDRQFNSCTDPSLEQCGAVL